MNADRWLLGCSRGRRLTLSGGCVVLERSEWCAGWVPRRDRRALFVGHRSRFHDTGCSVFSVYSLKNRTGGFFFVPRKGGWRQYSPLNGVRDDRDQLVDVVLEEDVDDQRCTNVKFRLASSMPRLSWWPPPPTSAPAPASARRASPVRWWWRRWLTLSSRTSSRSYSAPRAVGACRNTEFCRFAAIEGGKRPVSAYEPRGSPRKIQVVAPQVSDIRCWSRRRARRGENHDRRGRRRAAPADQQRSVRSVLGTPPAADIVCGRHRHDRSAEERTVFEARQPARPVRLAGRQPGTNGSSGSRRGGIQRAHRPTGGIVG